MRYLVLIITGLFLSALVNAQPLGDINKYLQNPKIHEGAKQYYNDERKAGVDSFTERIADSLKTKNNGTRPFYLLLVSKMFLYADAGLANMLFDDSYDMLEKRPNELIEFLYCNSKFVQSDFKKYWANVITNYIGKQHPGEGKEYLEKLRPKLMKVCKKNNKANLKAFLDSIAGGL